MANGEVIDRRECQSVMAAYAARAVVRASSDDFRDEIDFSISELDPANRMQSADIVSASILWQIADNLGHEQPLILSPEIKSGHNLYLIGQGLLDSLDMTTQRSEMDMDLLGLAARRLDGSDEPAPALVETAVDRWQKRGLVPVAVSSVRDVKAAVESFGPDTAPDIYTEDRQSAAEVFLLGRLPVEQFTEQRPYYYSFASIERSSAWLTSLLTDLAAIQRAARRPAGL